MTPSAEWKRIAPGLVIDGRRGEVAEGTVTGDGGADVRESRSRSGRARATTHGELSHLALRMFVERGFERTTVDEIAAAAGIGRRTLFRYFPSKNDLAWGEFDDMLARFRVVLASLPTDIPVREALRRAVIAFNTFPSEEVPFHRQRMWLLLNVPTLVAHSTLRYAAWRQVIAEYVASRSGDAPDALRPQSVAWACLGVCLATYERWLREEDADLPALLDESFRRTGAVFGGDRG